MSYNISLRDPITKDVLVLDEPFGRRSLPEIKEDIYTDGTYEARTHIPYGYAKLFSYAFPPRPFCKGDADYLRNYVDGMTIKGVYTIFGMTGAASIPVLQDAVNKLADGVDPDYWRATEGNAKQALLGLLALARMRPDGIWIGD